MERLSFEQEISVYGVSYVDGTRVSVCGLDGVSEQEAREYIKDIKMQYPHEDVVSIELSPADGDNVDIKFAVRPPPFRRIRRITGKPTVSP